MKKTLIIIAIVAAICLLLIGKAGLVDKIHDES